MIYLNEIKNVYSNVDIYNYEFQNYKDDIYFWKKLVCDLKPKKILEIGIGTGRIIELLHDMVNEYIGVDISIQLINYCKMKYDYKNVKLYNLDARSLKLNQKVDMVILPFNVINNFYTYNDFKQLFNSIFNLCNDDTVVIIDTFNPCVDDLKSIIKYRVTHKFKMDLKLVNVFEKHYYNKLDQTNIYYKKYVSNGKIIHEYILPNRIIFPEELKSIVLSNGFEIIEKYGDYNFERMSDNSRKQLLLIRRCK